MEPHIGSRIQFLPPHLHAYRTGKISHLPVDEKGYLVKLDTSLYVEILTLVKPGRFELCIFENRNAPIEKVTKQSLGNGVCVTNIDPQP